VVATTRVIELLGELTEMDAQFRENGTHAALTMAKAVGTGAVGHQRRHGPCGGPRTATRGLNPRAVGAGRA